MMVRFFKFFAMMAILLSATLGISTNSAHASGDEDPIYTGTFSSKALRGYDTVSYFQGDGVPVKGSSDFQTEWRGADWYFLSQANLDAFKANPEKYAPQYGGYCAWAIAHGTLAKGDPLVYQKIGDKVYLNYDKSIHKKWEPRKEELIAKGDEKYLEEVDLSIQ